MKKISLMIIITVIIMILAAHIDNMEYGHTGAIGGLLTPLHYPKQQKGEK